jgi:putative lipoprotein
MATPLLRHFLAATVFLAVAFGMLATMAETRIIDGTVVYRERMALPPEASVEVKLVDVSLADAPATTIAEITITPKGQVPIPYRLEYDSSKIVAGRSYALQARISVGGQLWFMTTTRHPVFTGGADKADILVQHVAGAVSPDSPVGRWLAEDIRGGGVIDRLQTILEIAADGAVSGTGGCNRMSGKATISGDRIRFGPIASTYMACVPAIMDQEAKFLAALQEVRGWRTDPVKRKLTLFDEGGKALIVLTQL